MFRSNGLIDDFVVFGVPEDYLSVAEAIQNVITSNRPRTLETNSPISIEITIEANEENELFTSLQNENDEYLTMSEWQGRNILRVKGSKAVLKELRQFLVDLSGRGEGYSYISEYSENYKYSHYSPEWRLYIEHT